MFKSKTVFVIGAGCSREYGLPLGDGLKVTIAGLLRGAIRSRYRNVKDEYVVALYDEMDNQFIDATHHLADRKWNEYRESMSAMVQGIGHAVSIDRYLDFNRDDERIVEVGKLAITRSILSAESRSSLTISGDTLDTENVRKIAEGPHWLGELFHRLIEGVDRANVAEMFDNVSFVCFNYDRCIEHYLFNALKEFGRFTNEEVAAAARKLTVLHPYGQVGRLPWQEGGLPIADFGQDFRHPQHLIEISQGIRLYTEQAESLVAEGIRAEIQQADQLVFLGFSYLKQNMDLLTLTGGSSNASSIFGTAFLESAQNCQIAQRLITDALKGVADRFSFGANLVDARSGKFMADYGNLLRG